MFYPSYGFTRVQEIISEGTYNMGDGETAHVAESRALLNAKRVALEQAGTYIESYSKVENLQLTKDEIQVLSSGIMEVQILDKKRSISGDSFHFYVKIKAKVDPDRIQEMAKKAKEKSVIEDYKKIQEAYNKSQKEIEELKKRLAEKREEGKKQVEERITYNEKQFQVNVWYEKGKQHFYKNELDEAIEAYTRAIELNPNDADAYYARGVTYRFKKQNDMAVTDYNQAISINPKNAGFYHARGVFYLDKVMEEANSINPNQRDAYMNGLIANARKGTGDISMAIADLKKACTMGDEDACKDLPDIQGLVQ